MTNLTVQPGIMEITPYIGGGSDVDGVNQIIKLSSNESALGPSPKACAALMNLKHMMHRYPDGDCTNLRHAISDVHGIDVDGIVCGSGSDELISLICQAYAGPGDEVLYSEHGFLMYPISARAVGASPVKAPESNLTANVDALLGAVTEKTRLLFLANPNNPTGTYISSAEMTRLRAGLPNHVLLIIDAAYSEYVDHVDYDNGINLVKNNDNVVMTRTFSKIYGLSGMRLGWAYCPKPVIDVLHRVRGPFNVNSMAQTAGIAAVRDEAFTKQVCNHNKIWLPWTSTRLRELGLSVTDSIGNFILCGFDNIEGKNAETADLFLRKRGIIVRRMTGYGLPNYLRITIGTEVEMVTFIETLDQFLGNKKG